MTLQTLIDDVVAQFQPYSLIVEEALIKVNIKRALRRLNNVATPTRVNIVAKADRVTLSGDVVAVAEVYHDAMTEESTASTSLQKTLLGHDIVQNMEVLDTAARIQYLNELYGMLGTTFYWKFEEISGTKYLFTDDVPDEANYLFVVEYYMLDPEDSVDNLDTTEIPKDLEEWMYEYVLALCKIDEGRILARSTAAETDMGGSELYSEGMESKRELETDLERRKKFLIYGGQS